MFRTVTTKQLSTECKVLLMLALPLIASSMVGQSLGFFNSIFLSRLGQDALAAGSVVNLLVATLMTGIWGSISAVNILTAHAHGANDEKDIACVLKNGLTLAFFAAIPTMFLLWNVAPILLLLGQKPGTIELAKPFLHSLTWAILPDFIFSVLLHFLVGLGQTRLNLMFTLIWVTLTVTSNYFFIFGKFGAPALGISGIGWGTAIAFWIMLIILGSFILFHKKYQRYRQYFFNKSCQLNRLKELLYIGLPMGFMYCIEAAFFFSVVLMMGTISSAAQAANQIALQFTSVVSVAAFGFGQAATVQIGHSIGAKKLELAQRTGYLSIMLAGFIMLFVAFIFWHFGYQLINIDFDIYNPKNTPVVELAKQFLLLAALFQIVEGIRLAAIGGLRGWKDTQFSMLVSIISFWGIALPLGYVFAKRLNWHGQGIWAGIALGQMFSALILIRRYRKVTKQYREQPREAKVLIAEVKKDLEGEIVLNPPHL